MNVLGEKLEKNHHNPYHVFFPQNIFPSHKICIAKKKFQGGSKMEKILFLQKRRELIELGLSLTTSQVKLILG